MKTVQIGNATLILGDCMDVLPTLPKVDAVITDPPYGIGFKYESHDDTSENYGPWLWSIIQTAESKCNEGAPIFVFQAVKNINRFHEWFPRNWRVYIAAKNFVQIRKGMQYGYDPVVCWWTDGEPWYAGNCSRDFFVADTASQITGRGIEKGHPCPRPLDQMRSLVFEWVRPQGFVLDPFMGSGTTGVAAIQLGRKFIGIEREPKYFDIACQRIEQAVAQGQLFEHEKPKQVQAQLL